MSTSNDEIIRTGAVVESKSIQWSIENFELVRSSDELISSQKVEFQAGSSIGLPTKWSFYLKSVLAGGEPKKKWIAAFLQLSEMPKDVKNLWAKYTLRSIGPPNGPTGPKFESDVEDHKNFLRGWGFEKVIDPSADIGTLPLVDGVLTLAVDFQMYTTTGNQDWDVQQKEKEFEVKFSQQLTLDLFENLDNLASDHLSSPVELLSKDGVRFPSNRAILFARSHVFRQMFEAKMKESLTGVVEIDDILSQSLRLLHKYLHTGQLDPTWKSEDIIKDFVYGAHKYQLGILVSFLDLAVGKVGTSLKTAKIMAPLANKLGLKTAERELVNFIRTHAQSADDITIVTKTGEEDGDSKVQEKNQN